MQTFSYGELPAGHPMQLVQNTLNLPYLSNLDAICAHRKAMPANSQPTADVIAA